MNYNIIIAITKRIVTANDRTLLKENGGTIELGNKWCESITKQIGFVKRKATTAKPIIAPGLIFEIGHTFYHGINEIAKAHEIPPEMVINKDQLSLPFILISKYILEEKGASRVSVPDTTDYCQITGTFGIIMAGNVLPIQLIYHGKTLLSQSINFQKNFMLPRPLIIGLMKKLVLPSSKMSLSPILKLKGES